MQRDAAARTLQEKDQLIFKLAQMYNTVNSDRTKLRKERDLHKIQIQNLKIDRVAKEKLIQEKTRHWKL
jgi:hypothetical protein